MQDDSGNQGAGKQQGGPRGLICETGLGEDSVGGAAQKDQEPGSYDFAVPHVNTSFSTAHQCQLGLCQGELPHGSAQQCQLDASSVSSPQYCPAGASWDFARMSFPMAGPFSQLVSKATITVR